MPAGKRLSLEAFAKINLFLEVRGRRPDGYHRLSTLFQEVSLSDTLAFSERSDEKTRLFCRGIPLPRGTDNLVLKTIASYRKDSEFGIRNSKLKGLDIVLYKRIPVGAGLGGGSSDAAAALKALWHLSAGKPKEEFPWRRFVPLARRLGADVPFFLRGGRAEAGGIGDQLTPLPPGRTAWFVLLFPRISIPTRWVYGALRFPLTKTRSIHTLKRLLSRGAPPREWALFLYNRLEEVVLPRREIVAKARRALFQAGCLNALLSGSGSSVFGVAENEAHGRRILRGLRSEAWDGRLVHSRF